VRTQERSQQKTTSILMITKHLSIALLSLCIAGSATATQFRYTVALDGPSEFPPKDSPGTGVGSVAYDNVAHTLDLEVTFSGLLGTTTASHIHAPTAEPFEGTASVATTVPNFAGFPVGVMSGSYTKTLDLTAASSWNPAYVTANGGTPAAAEAAFAAALASGKAYWNIHSTFAASGEIRGFLQPEPPVVTLSATPSVLWPPNRKPVAVSIDAQISGGSGLTACEIVDVTSNESSNGGNSGPDWEVTGPLTLMLRAERAGRGDGRVYTIAVECEDEAGVRVTEEVMVAVPKGH
jgi:hypothetical protein